MKKTRAAMEKRGVRTLDGAGLPSSEKRFPDGAHYRIEIPSVETPEALETALQEADRHKVTLHRVSQGSGIMMLTDDEIGRMVRLARDARIELSLFVGP